MHTSFLSPTGKATAVFLLALSSCATNAPVRDASAPSSSPDPVATPSPEDRQATVQISVAFRQRCSLAESAQAAPDFAFDEVTLHAKGKNVLDEVATCLIDGPLKGEAITIIGRTDARGTASHNEDLGKSRAGAARNYLVQKGVAAERIHVMSRGEKGARGESDAGFALDRRVDLELGDLKSSPILQGTMLQGESAPAPSKSKAGNYADTGNGPVGGSSVTGAGSAAGAK